MTDSAKTIAFAAAALLSVILAIITRPSTGEYDPSDQLGTPVAESFEPGEAKRLRIVKVDEATATSEKFEVAEKNGVWSLPSKGGYPADAERKIAEAVTGVTDREILLIASQDPNDHAEYGVIDPDSSKLEPGQTGVGTRVSLSDGTGETLVDLIIGAEVKDQESQRYVRRAGQDVVFVVEIDPESFSTDFSEWIESDLLKISPWDLQQVRIRDYTAELLMTFQGMAADLNYRTDMTLRYDDAESEWELVSLGEAADAKQDEYTPRELGADEELDDDSLSELKNALDDLSIVDVSSKPEGLSDSLKAGEEFLKDEQSMLSLITRGFAPFQRKGGELDLLSSEGEVICTMKDGVEYVLRFGNLELDSDAAESAGGSTTGEGGSPDEDETDESDEGGEGVNRYLFVMARFNADVIDQPELEEVPPLPTRADESEAEDSEPTDSEAESDETAEEGSDEADDAEADAEEGDTETEESGDEPSELEQAVAERRDIEERNARLLDEYEEKLEAGRTRVRELNARFGDWYYVISNDVYKKIHLGKDDIIKQKEPAEGEDDAAAEPDSSAFGAPGAAVPGLPGLPGLGAALEQDAAEDTPAEEGPAEETAEAAPSEKEASAAEEPAEAEPAAEEPSEEAEPAAAEDEE